MEQYLTLTVTDYEGTVEGYLRARAKLTRRQISRAKFYEKGILKNGCRCRVTEPLAYGDVISVCLETEQINSSHLTVPTDNMVFPEILYEDSDVIAVNKPAGTAIHPSGGHYNDTLSNQIYAYYANKDKKVCCRSVGRLDRVTSGIVLFAKNRPSAALLQKQRADGILQKQYLAIVSGYLPTDTDTSDHRITFPIKPDLCHPLKMQAVKNPLSGSDTDSLSGRKNVSPKTAVTHYRVLYGSSDWSLLLLRLETGRTHQIRVHMAALDHPLLGDTLYGSHLPVPQPFRFTRAALHARRTDFIQPFSGKSISLEAPLPGDFLPVRQFLNKLP